MGNVGSSGGGGGSGRRRNQNHHHHLQQHPGPSILPPPPPTPQPPTPPPEVSAGNRYVFAAATHYPQYPNPNSPQYYQYVGYYPPPPPMPAQLPAPFDHHHRSGDHPVYPQSWANAPRYACGAAPPPPTPFVEHQKAITIRNDVNLKKETLRIEPDEENPGRYLVAFSFDATVAGSITVIFFAKEGFNCDLMPMKGALLAPVTVSFKDGLGQKFKQPPGTGIDLSLFEEADLIKDGETEIYPLAVKAEAVPVDKQGLMGNQGMVALNSQITQAVFEKKENGEYQIRVVKQILWVNGTRYELQEIYGIGNSCDGDFDENDPGKECVICLSEPRDTTVLPCRHMCMCSGCAKLLRYQTNRCPICRQPVERLLEIKVNNRSADEHQEPTTTQHTVVETSGQTPMLKALP